MEKITIKTEYITLGQFIKYLSLVSSGGEVKMFLQMNDIFVNGEVENRRGKKLHVKDQITINSVVYKLIQDENK